MFYVRESHHQKTVSNAEKDKLLRLTLTSLQKYFMEVGSRLKVMRNTNMSLFK